MKNTADIIDNLFVGLGAVAMITVFIAGIIYGEKSFPYFVSVFVGLTALGLLWFRLIRPLLNRRSSTHDPDA